MKYVIKANVHPPAYLSAGALPWQTDREEATIFNEEQAEIVLYITRAWQLREFNYPTEMFEPEPVAKPLYYVRYKDLAGTRYANPSQKQGDSPWLTKEERVPLLTKGDAIALLRIVRKWGCDQRCVRLVSVG